MAISRRQRWLILGIENVCFIALAAWVLLGIGQLDDPFGWAVALAIIGVGDILTALLMQHFAPTRITLEPGEGMPLIGAAVSDFAADGYGRVLVRGERWRAQRRGGRQIVAGARVRILARKGLTLLVEPAE